MSVVLLCATARGLAVLERVLQQVPPGELIVVSFREEPDEPPFLDEIRSSAERIGARFLEARDVSRVEEIWGDGLDLMLAVSWRYLVPPSVFGRARRGAFVLHDSLLPAYRGFSPTVWAVINGERQVGATLFAMTEEMDAGDIVGQRPVDLDPDETIAGVMTRVTKACTELVDAHLPAMLAGSVRLTQQDHRLATYTCRRVAADNLVRWDEPTTRIYNLVRAVTRPYPGAFAFLGRRRLRIWAARPTECRPYAGRVPGRVIEVIRGSGAIVLTGDGALLVKTVQLDGSEPAGAAEVLTSLGHTLRDRPEDASGADR